VRALLGQLVAALLVEPEPCVVEREPDVAEPEENRAEPLR